MMHLFYLSECRFGGWVSYTAHLQRALAQAGIEALIVKVAHHTETKLRPFAGGTFYQNLSLRDACSLGGGLITAVQFKKFNVECAALLRSGSAITLHDPTEFDPALLGLLKSVGPPVFTIRRAPSDLLTRQGIANTFVRHPYVPAAPPAAPVTRAFRAVTLSRLDWDKNIDLVLDANARGAQIRVFGEANRMYLFHKLDPNYPAWRRAYGGRFNSALAIARQADYVVDMSTISGDGGGMQYTFLEAFDAGCALVVNRRWLRADDDTFVEGVNVLAASTGAELADVLRCAPPSLLIDAGRRTMALHTAPDIARAYADLGVLV